MLLVIPPFLHYALVVSFFPHLIAGPILIYWEILPQFVDSRTFGLGWHYVTVGLALFSLDLFEKVVIADSMSLIVSGVFNTDVPHGFGES